MKYNLIGIAGKAGSGKDEFLSYFNTVRESESAPMFMNRKFADGVKHIAGMLTGLSWVETHTQEGKNKYLPDWGMTMREMQQKIGTDAMRNGLHKDVWVISSFAEFAQNSLWAFTDVRFPNEAEAILKKEGILIRIENNRVDTGTHLSETSLDNWAFEHIIYNNGTLEEYHKEIELFMKKNFYL